jgi:hypothetical protein
MKKRISAGLFLVVILLFLTPWLEVSCAGAKVISFSGMDMVTGKSYTAPSGSGYSSYNSNFGVPNSTSTSSNREPLAIITLVLAVAGIIFSLVKWKRAELLSALAAICGFIFMIALKIKIDGDISEQGRGMLQTDYLAGYWIGLILLMGIFLINILRQGISFKFSNTASADEKPNDGAGPPP